MKHHQDWNNEKRAGYILDALSAEGVSGELLVRIQGWLVSDDNPVEKERQLYGIAERMFEEHRQPRERTYELLRQAQERLGFPDSAMVGRPKRAPLRKRLGFKVAAALIPVAVVAGVVFISVDGAKDRVDAAKEDTTIISVAVGSPEMVGLPDGSSVRLHGDSKLVCAANFTEDRYVKLEGEAYFRVENMDGEPFVVEAGNITVKVIGTEFNLKTDREHTIVSLTSGVVEVSDRQGYSVTLKPMERLDYDNLGRRASITGFDESIVGLWKNGAMEINDLPQAEALRRIGEIYNMDVVINTTFSARSFVTTMLRESDSLESVLEVMSVMNEGFRYSVDDDTITVWR